MDHLVYDHFIDGTLACHFPLSSDLYFLCLKKDYSKIAEENDFKESTIEAEKQLKQKGGKREGLGLGHGKDCLLNQIYF